MSLLRASGMRCCSIRPSRMPAITSKFKKTVLARSYSDISISPEILDELSEEQSRSPRAKREPSENPYLWDVLPANSPWRFTKFPELFTLSKDVENAFRERKPIVGLETAIYTHGFPKPDNYTLALEMEHTVRDHGAVPATIGILNGKIHIGMTNDQLEELAYTAGSEKTSKISRRDIAYHVGKSGFPLNGGTTIAGTIKIAHSVGIKVVATGGLGGVHKGGENSMDISTDLTELGRCCIAVITSGMKSFLDTARTMEFLETQGVFVSTFGNPNEKVDIPGFFSRESGYKSPYVVEGPEEAANIFFASQLLNMGSGSLFFNPIPEEYEIPKAEMDPILESATSKSSNITGKDNTPAVLNEIVKQTEGRSIRANRRLVLNNAKIGAQTAVLLNQLHAELSERRRELRKAHKVHLGLNDRDQEQTDENPMRNINPTLPKISPRDSK
ncbi:hypothetical protein TWF694_006865 [Orbilia ellipsospora]|uniref:Uncharacterized protein n=1 Tax=Orbilia ellipsospora TaxID=2528407 RepID=A0AAV9XLE8_9PEZI